MLTNSHEDKYDKNYSAVLGVRSSDGRHCTGFAISTTQIVTAAHCHNVADVCFARNFGACVSDPTLVHSVIPNSNRCSRRLDAQLLTLAVPLGLRADELFRLSGTLTAGSVPHATTIIGFGMQNANDLNSGGVRSFGTLTLAPSTSPAGFGCGRFGSDRCNTAYWFASDPVGSDSCPGDSGGPVMLNDAQRLVLGIVSARLQQSPLCGTGTLLVRADQIDRWLQRQPDAGPDGDCSNWQ